MCLKSNKIQFIVLVLSKKNFREENIYIAANEIFKLLHFRTTFIWLCNKY